ncbi:hypothetical protein BDZ45DRAFT_798984 [Acephala macrosclerotiorum]|nr:hypothetical protein BDZ45DRAFT_798984 [Acephala macrosclerotiorum]
MTGSSFNRVIAIAFSSPACQISRYIIRNPRLPLDEVEVQNIEDQANILLYLSKYLPAAKVKAYHRTTENAIGSQYVAYERLPGSLSMLFSHDILQFTKEIDVAGCHLDVSSDIPTANEESFPTILCVMCKACSEDDAEDEELRSFW